MTIKKYISRGLNTVFFLTIVLFLLDVLRILEIKSQVIKSFAYFGIIIFPFFMLIWNLWQVKSTKWKIVSISLSILIIIGVLIVGPLKIIYASRSWKTQKICYQNGHFSFKKVEFQMQDVGALGYHKRTVCVTYITDFFMIVNEVEIDIDKRVEWIKIDQEINELNLKSY